MELSLSEAATLLGKSVRQVRYLIARGHASARKQDGRWLVRSESLPLTEAQRAQLHARVAKARQAFDKAVAPASKIAEARKTYSVTDLDAFRVGATLLEALRADAADGPTRLLAQSLEELGCGCHEYHPRAKQKRFHEARDFAARAVVQLLTENQSQSTCAVIAQRIEAELIPKLAGLAAAQEKRVHRARFSRFRFARGEAEA